MPLATSNCVFLPPGARRLASAGLAILGCLTALGATPPAPGATEARTYLTEVYQKAQGACQDRPEDPAAATAFGRATFDLAEWATNRTERADLAEQGLAACRHALAAATNSPALHYYLAMNLAQLARTKGWGALKLVTQMRQEFDLARRLDESLDAAGPDRNLGLLHRDAPAVISIGDRKLAQRYLEHAVALAPNYPDNRLSLAESYLKWGERRSARRQLEALEEALAAARATWAGPAWAWRWREWEADLAHLKKQAADPPRGREPIKDRD